MSKRTAIFWIDGDRYVFREQEVDDVLALASEAETFHEAWERTRDYGEEINA